jgi:hypothetical protein
VALTLADRGPSASGPERAREAGARALDHEREMTWRRVAERLPRALRPGGIDVGSLSAFLDRSTVTPLA